jgi:peptidoglycan/LPS O-acetylase OafA/YrhL
LIRSGAQIAVATTAMTVACLVVALVFPPGQTWSQRLLSVGAPMAASFAVYFGLARAFGMSEISLLFRWQRSAP